MLTEPQCKRPEFHFRRVEVKYLIPKRLQPVIMKAIAPNVIRDPILTGQQYFYDVSSLYYDSADLHAYHEKCSGLLSRCKVRLRTYSPYFRRNFPIYLEVKRRWDIAISKDRFLCPESIADSSSFALSDITRVLHTSDTELSDEVQLLSHWFNLQPTAFVHYQRYPFIGMYDSRLRLTFDSSIKSIWKPSCVTAPMTIQPCLEQCCVLELKSNHPIPYWFSRIVHSFGLERLSVSKYALAVRHHLRLRSSGSIS